MEDKSDSRNERHTPTIDSFNIVHEAGLTECSESKLAKASAEAVNWTRDLANTRATECNPQYMEDKIRSLIAGSDLCKLEVIKGE